MNVVRLACFLTIFCKGRSHGKKKVGKWSSTAEGEEEQKKKKEKKKGERGLGRDEQDIGGWQGCRLFWLPFLFFSTKSCGIRDLEEIFTFGFIVVIFGLFVRATAAD